jgi:exonuclease-1
VRYADLGSIEKPSFVSFDPDMFRAMCILSGCDYVPSLPGVGLKKVRFVSLEE